MRQKIQAETASLFLAPKSPAADLRKRGHSDTRPVEQNLIFLRNFDMIAKDSCEKQIRSQNGKNCKTDMGDKMCSIRMQNTF